MISAVSFQAVLLLPRFHRLLLIQNFWLLVFSQWPWILACSSYSGDFHHIQWETHLKEYSILMCLQPLPWVGCMWFYPTKWNLWFETVASCDSSVEPYGYGVYGYGRVVDWVYVLRTFAAVSGIGQFCSRSPLSVELTPQLRGAFWNICSLKDAPPTSCDDVDMLWSCRLLVVAFRVASSSWCSFSRVVFVEALHRGVFLGVERRFPRCREAFS